MTQPLFHLKGDTELFSGVAARPGARNSIALMGITRLRGNQDRDNAPRMLGGLLAQVIQDALHGHFRATMIILRGGLHSSTFYQHSIVGEKGRQ